METRERENISVLLLPEQKEVLKKLARRSGESMAAEVRRLIRQEGARCGLWPPNGEEHCAQDH